MHGVVGFEATPGDDHMEADGNGVKPTAVEF